MTSVHDNIVGRASYYQNGIDYLLFGECFFPPKYIFSGHLAFQKRQYSTAAIILACISHQEHQL